MSDRKKPVLLMLAAHEPYGDPRVDWAARTAAQSFETVVFGLFGYGRTRGEREVTDAYEILRFERPLQIRPDFVSRLIEGVMELSAKRVQRKTPRRVGYPLVLIISAIMAGCEIAVRVVFDTLGLLWRWFPRSTLALISGMRASRGAGAQGSPRTAPPRPGFAARAQMFRDTFRHVLGTAQVFWFESIDLPKIDVVYCNDFDTLLPGVLIAINRGCKLVYDSHEYWPYSNVEALGIHVWFFRTMERILARRADAVLTVSDPLAAELKRAYGLAKVEVVPNAEPWIEGAAAAATAKPGGEIARLAAGRVSFLFQGNFAPQRGLEELLDAWSGVDDRKAVLFLRGPDSPWRRDIAERARQLGLLDRTVFILPPVTVAELVAAARQVDVGVIPYKPDLPAYRYACPNKLSQYMHAGLAILSNNIGYVAGQIAAGDCGAVYDSRRDSIIGAVMKLAEDREALERFKRNALAYGRDTFNWQVQSRPLAALLRGWAGEPPECAVPAAAE